MGAELYAPGNAAAGSLRLRAGRVQARRAEAAARPLVRRPRHWVHPRGQSARRLWAPLLHHRRAGARRFQRVALCHRERHRRRRLRRERRRHRRGEGCRERRDSILLPPLCAHRAAAAAGARRAGPKARLGVPGRLVPSRRLCGPPAAGDAGQRGDLPLARARYLRVAPLAAAVPHAAPAPHLGARHSREATANTWRRQCDFYARGLGVRAGATRVRAVSVCHHAFNPFLRPHFE
mmetsp:Transcript_3786/g.12730  ORF Transcript_3786/g.12730 Transcript_3786/m.12730 type:complete len:235 (+) Transcript_3786:648-1352(+)